MKFEPWKPGHMVFNFMEEVRMDAKLEPVDNFIIMMNAEIESKMVSAYVNGVIKDLING